MAAKKIKTIVADDGSTATKLAWHGVKGALQTAVIQNRATLGTMPGFNSVPYTYRTDHSTFTFSDYANALPTSNLDFQFSELSRASVQNALQQSGLDPQSVNLAVTLPISMYFDENGLENMANIDRKKTTHLGGIIAVGREAFKIDSVTVYPEGLPAVFDYVNDDTITDSDTVLLVDFGGTTLDLCAFYGKVATIAKVDSFEVGTLSILNRIMAEVMGSADGMKLTLAHADEILKTGNCPGAFIENFNIANAAENVLSEAVSRIVNFISQVSSPTKIFLCGGGAGLLEPMLRDYFGKAFVMVAPDNQTALAKAIANIEKSKAE